MKNYQIALVAALIIMPLCVYILAKHDAAVSEAADRYEDCVREEYGTTPAQYKVENGAYPTCDFNKK